MQFIFAGPHELAHEYHFKKDIKKILQKTTIPKIHVSLVSMENQKCVTQEKMMDYYNGKVTSVHRYEKSIGESLENFISLGLFSKVVLLVRI